MRIPRPLRSAIQLRAKDRTAALLALYTEKDGKPLIEAIEPVRITEAPSANSGSAFCTVNSRPRTLVLKILAHPGLLPTRSSSSRVHRPPRFRQRQTKLLRQGRVSSSEDEAR